jgi:hypothetical protein
MSSPTNSTECSRLGGLTESELNNAMTGNPDSFAARVIERLDEGVCANAICAQYGSGESESRCG